MSSKTAWLFNHYANEPSEAGGTRHFSLAKHMQAEDWEVNIIAASVDHFSGIQRLKPSEKYRCDKVDGVSFIWLKTPKYKGNGFFRVLNILVYTLQVYFGSWRSTQCLPDVIVGSSVHPLAAVAAALLAKKYSIPFVFEVRDLWPETLVAMGLWSKASWKTKLFRHLEKWLYLRAEKIITLLPYAHEYIVSLGVHEDKVVWVSNGVELNELPVYQERLGNENFVLMYLGSHGPANGLDTLLDAMAIIERKYSDSKIQLRMIGKGVDKAALVSKAKNNGLKTVSFENAVKKCEVPSLASEADAFVICVRDLPDLYRYGISMNKLYDYMAASRPVVIASNARNNPISDAKCGLSVPAEDSESLAKAIFDLSEASLEVREEMARSGRHFVEANFDYKILAFSFAGVLNEVWKKSKAGA